MPEYLFHYTDSYALHKILTECKIWATQLGQMNDSSEGRYARDLAKEVLIDMASQNSQEDTKYALTQIAELVGDSSFLQRTYVFSLSEDGESLSQWRAYTPSGGYSIGLDRNKLCSFCTDNGWELHRCVYDKEIQKTEIQQRIQAVIEAYKCISGTVFNNVASNIHQRIENLEIIYKHPSFKEEREWRVVCKPDPTDQSNYGEWRNRGAAIIGYKTLDFTGALKNSLDQSSLKVTFSPGVYSLDRSQTLFWMLLHNGYANPKISKSHAPYTS